ncbi:hypothetical protein AAFN85_00985 [Mucilaginibacter sp. CAU 1740]|uniref:hypothetical protein n=1 Tax=Mucilaginibacter sp. CAU 1740 TaxID=3140365 RepID=UPI00325AB847
MKQFLLILFAFLFCCADHASTQTRLDGVYAGCEFTLSPLIGSGMNRRDVAILFRPDGTFNEEMSGADWKTHVSGKYQVANGEVTMHYPKSTYHYTITKYGSLFCYSYELFKLQGDKLPPGYYAFTNGTTGGGPGSGMAFVGSMSQRGLQFDANGNFSDSHSSVAVVSADAIGGGASKSGGGSGTYKLNKGVLILTFKDGHTEQHSFFCDMDTKNRMAICDGKVFFAKDEDQSAKTSTPVKSATASTSTTTNIAAADGKALLLKANAAHGGDKLNSLKTARLTGSVAGLKVVELIDIPGNKVRVEVWKNGKPVSVQQTEGDSGWQWSNGSKTDLPTVGVAGIKTALYTGVIGLRKSALDQMQIVNTQKVPNSNAYAIACKLNGNDFVFAINDRNQLMAYAYKVGSKASSSVVSDMRPVQGITIPFREASTSGGQKLEIQYDNMDVNPVFDAQSWAVPQGS